MFGKGVLLAGVLGALSMLQAGTPTNETAIVVFLDPLAGNPQTASKGSLGPRTDAFSMRAAKQMQGKLAELAVGATISRASGEIDVPLEERRWRLLSADADMYVGLRGSPGAGDCVWVYHLPTPKGEEGHGGSSIQELYQQAAARSRIELGRSLALNLAEALRKSSPGGCVQLSTTAAEAVLDQAVPAVIVEFRLAEKGSRFLDGDNLDQGFSAIAAAISRAQKIRLPTGSPKPD